jgi:NAD-dependent SIR2 family protein deacetylase
MIDGVFKRCKRGKKTKCSNCLRLLEDNELILIERTGNNKYYCKSCGELIRNQRIKYLENKIKQVKGEVN